MTRKPHNQAGRPTSVLRKPAGARAPSRLMSSRAFSLIELLMAIFILGIGVISIAALLPAGIVQQQQSVDDVVGPIVADSAISIIRSKIRPEDFGSFENFSAVPPRPTIAGDWTWLRPGFYFNDVSGTPIVERGAIDIFSSGPVDATEFSGGSGLTGIPFNVQRHPAGPPAILITQRERYYPQHSEYPSPDGKPSAPAHYVWDCMFRRFEGRILVAIFVYRVNLPAGETRPYFVEPDISSPAVPPLPVWLDLTDGGADIDRGWDVPGPDGTPGTADDAFVIGTQPCDALDLFDIPQSWQVPGQWVLDQNNSIHQVLSVDCEDDFGGIGVQLVRPVPGLPSMPVYYSVPPGDGATNIVSDIWYIPPYPTGADGPRLTPVYVTVKEL